MRLFLFVCVCAACERQGDSRKEREMRNLLWLCEKPAIMLKERNIRKCTDDFNHWILCVQAFFFSAGVRKNVNKKSQRKETLSVASIV